MSRLHIPTIQDRMDAAAYWRGHERAKYAVDVTAGPAKRPKYAATWYCYARSGQSAIACVRREAWGLPARANFVARLAGPRELGCERTPT